MSGLENLNKRLQYRGGSTVISRLEKDKVRSLKNALHNSYQAETAVLGDNREFKCLINPDKLHMDYDNKIISIPYQDKCLNPDISTKEKNAQGLEEIGLKPGDTFRWKETNTHWLIFLQHLEESAYFRAEIRKCEQQVEINGKLYWVYLRGPVETALRWNQKASVEWNDMNYSLVMFITKDDNTEDFFHRFTKLKIKENNIAKTWQVVSHNNYYGDGMIQVFLNEDFENTIEEEGRKEQENEKPILPPIDKTQPYIDGPKEVHKYDTVTYTAYNFTEPGKWQLIENGKTSIINNSSLKITLDITKSKGNFSVQYKTINENAQLDAIITAF